jgi:hypothetical protein
LDESTSTKWNEARKKVEIPDEPHSIEKAEEEIVIYGQVVELLYTFDLKSNAARIEGWNPSLATNFIY